MEFVFQINKITRDNILSFIEPLSLTQLNAIPKGFNNNIAWNLGHIISVQQGLIYGLSGLSLLISPGIVKLFKKGTKPENPFSAEQVDELKTIALSVIDQTHQDYLNGVFKAYNTYTTSYNITLNNVEEALSFNMAHETMHFGYMKAILNSLSN